MRIRGWVLVPIMSMDMGVQRPEPTPANRLIGLPEDRFCILPDCACGCDVDPAN